MFYERYCELPLSYLAAELGFPSQIIQKFTKGLKKAMHGQGLGRHSPEEIHSCMERCLAAMNQKLGGSFKCTINTRIISSLKRA